MALQEIMLSLLSTMVTAVSGSRCSAYVHPHSQPLGGNVAKFAGKNVHKRLLAEEAYREKRYDEALKRAFLGTDEDLLAGTFLTLSFAHLGR
jgi:hypothetical protein